LGYWWYKDSLNSARLLPECSQYVLGQERFKSLTPLYYRDAKICFLVFDLNSERSLAQLKSWYGEIMKHINQSDDDYSNGAPTILIVVGSKLDLERKIPYNSGQSWAASINSQYIEVSSLDGTNIDSLFLVAYAQMKMQDQRKSTTT